MKQIYFIIMVLFVFNSACKKEDSATSPEDSIVDGLITYNGHTYHTVKIGTQEWTVENLRSTLYNDGTAISKVTDNTEWSNLTTGAYCTYENSDNNSTTYGLLYNWYAVNTGKLAPNSGGWRVPTNEDWTKLSDYLGGEAYAGTKLKAKSGWYNSGNGTDDYGFNAIPGGERISGGNFYNIGNSGNWWSSSAIDSDFAWYRYLFHTNTYLIKNYFKKHYGFSVRLVRDK